MGEIYSGEILGIWTKKSAFHILCKIRKGELYEQKIKISFEGDPRKQDRALRHSLRKGEFIRMGFG